MRGFAREKRKCAAKCAPARLRLYATAPICRRQRRQQRTPASRANDGGKHSQQQQENSPLQGPTFHSSRSITEGTAKTTSKSRVATAARENSNFHRGTRGDEGSNRRQQTQTTTGHAMATWSGTAGQASPTKLQHTAPSLPEDFPTPEKQRPFLVKAWKCITKHWKTLRQIQRKTKCRKPPIQTSQNDRTFYVIYF